MNRFELATASRPMNWWLDDWPTDKSDFCDQTHEENSRLNRIR